MEDKDEVLSFDFNLKKADKVVHPDGSVTFTLKRIKNENTIKDNSRGKRSDNKD